MNTGTGFPTQFAQGNGLKRDGELNSGVQLVSLHYGKGYTASPLDGGGFTKQSPKLMKHRAALDEAGNTTSLTSAYGFVKNRCFSYDSRSRLSTVSRHVSPRTKNPILGPGFSLSIQSC